MWAGLLMEVKDKLVVYEKMYLHESEVKEKITIRVQIIFTLIIAVVAVSSYILRMLDFSEYLHVAYVIIILLLVFLGLLGVACFYAVRAFWGNLFALVPSAQKVDDYCKQMEIYSAEVKAADLEEINVRSEVEEFLCDSYRESAANNYEVNKLRAGRVHLSFRFLLFSLAPLLCAGSLFIGFDMDASSPRKNYQIIDKYVGDQLGALEKRLDIIAVNTSELKEVVMSASEDESAKGEQEDTPSKPIVEMSAAPPLSAAPKKPERPQVQFVMNMELRQRATQAPSKHFLKPDESKDDEPSDK